MFKHKTRGYPIRTLVRNGIYLNLNPYPNPISNANAKPQLTNHTVRWPSSKCDQTMLAERLA